VPRSLDAVCGSTFDPIWQVARATAAASTYFKPVVIDGLEYVDGGFRATNNPCEEIYHNVKKMNNNAKKCVKIVVSIGTGKSDKLTLIKGQGLYQHWN
jgi:patatin-like phospholipase/acyl hydrolase